jgi:hypothetical protein
MGRTACTEPQCLYSRAIPLLPLWAVRPVQSLSAYTRVHFTFFIQLDRTVRDYVKCESVVFVDFPDGLVRRVVK